MSDYRRWYVPGGTLFFTVVSYDRLPILTTDAGRTFLRTSIESVRARHPFTLVATTLLGLHDDRNWLSVETHSPEQIAAAFRMKCEGTVAGKRGAPRSSAQPQRSSFDRRFAARCC